MISRRIWQKRAWSACPPLLPRQLPPPLAEITSRKHPPLPHVSPPRLTFSGHALPPFRSYNNPSVHLNVVDRRWFSSQALADVAGSGVVDVPLAQTGEGIAECELLKWFVKEGDVVEEFQPLCEVQSDKATIEITSRYKGKVVQVLYTPGDIVKVRNCCGGSFMFLGY
ncbi:hypothetical protein Tsubulata_032315 [Turnera subulata]|uniref:Lipoamide acyltransferase component of branched-chain alpha-keto acid dehydrogenase complex, mitochondrial n=1 Tax=Turnera subulata TaxID=218843 RepID=A0A9Q0JCW6_9ROSI|nr:hypothetical protein Tsubulata_032315 [Turnera subulata]